MPLLGNCDILGLYFDLTTKSSGFIGDCLKTCTYKYTEVYVGGGGGCLGTRVWSEKNSAVGWKGKEPQTFLQCLNLIL